MITFICGVCHYSRQVNDDLAGKRAKCPKCGSIVRLPAGIDPAAATGPIAPPPAPVPVPKPFAEGRRFRKWLVIASVAVVSIVLAGIGLVLVAGVRFVGSRIEVVTWRTGDDLPGDLKVKIPSPAMMQLGILRAPGGKEVRTRLHGPEESFLVVTVRIPPPLLEGETAGPEGPLLHGKWYYILKREDFRLVLPAAGGFQEAEGFAYNAVRTDRSEYILGDRFIQGFPKPLGGSENSVEWVVVFVVKKVSAGPGVLKIQFKLNPPTVLP